LRISAFDVVLNFWLLGCGGDKREGGGRARERERERKRKRERMTDREREREKVLLIPKRGV
jgi:hypothetical protein